MWSDLDLHCLLLCTMLQCCNISTTFPPPTFFFFFLLGGGERRKGDSPRVKFRLLTSLRKKPFESIMGKGEYTGHQHFLLFPRCFLFSFSHYVFCPIRNINHDFINIQFVICKCFEFGPVQKIVVRVNPLPDNKF